jgi:BirA family transcriptional regulator, biotin operon repressor / biotin---[acetyl-CoA-carboxylase] ligase
MGDGAATRPASSGRSDRWIVRHLDSVDSTNRVVLDDARAGAPAGLVVVADHQLAGRGRRDRAWEAPPGSSLLVSILLRPTMAAAQLHVVTIGVALALADALELVAGIRCALKWPNDLVVGDRKIAGLLAEADLSGEEVRAVVVGVGCNLAQARFPAALAPIATSCRLETGRVPDRDELLGALLEHLADRLDASPAETLADYRRRLATLGRVVRVELDAGDVVGEAEDVDEGGRLVIRPDAGPSVTVAVGDVVHLRAG